MDKKYYEVELGVLLNEDDDGYTSYKFNSVYAGKYSFYDECQYAFLPKSLDKEKEACRKYVEDGVANTYAIIKGPFIGDDELLKEIKENGEIDPYCYDINAVCFSIRKTDDGKIVEDFLKI